MSGPLPIDCDGIKLYISNSRNLEYITRDEASKRNLSPTGGLQLIERRNATESPPLVCLKDSEIPENAIVCVVGKASKKPHTGEYHEIPRPYDLSVLIEFFAKN